MRLRKSWASKGNSAYESNGSHRNAIPSDELVGGEDCFLVSIHPSTGLGFELVARVLLAATGP
jgi:hypothetical protein